MSSRYSANWADVALFYYRWKDDKKKNTEDQAVERADRLQRIPTNRMQADKLNYLYNEITAVRKNWLVQ